MSNITGNQSTFCWSTRPHHITFPLERSVPRIHKAFIQYLKALLGVILPLLGQDDDVLPDGSEPLLEQLDHGSLLPQILQLLGGIG